MSEAMPAEASRRAQQTIVQLYVWASLFLLVGIGLLVVYSIRLGPLVGPGVEESFGLALALMFLMGALLVHMVDRLYRVWPLGRKVRPTPAGPVTEMSVATFLKLLVVAVAAGGIAYVLGTLLS